jgi:anti-sigma-K factor RskA
MTIPDRCETIRPLTAAYVLEALDADERRQVARHLAVCPDCQAELSHYQTVADRLLMAVPAQMPPRSLRAGLIARLAEHEGPVDRQRQPVGWLRLVTLALGLLLAGLNLAVLWRSADLARQVDRRLAEIETRSELQADMLTVNQTALALSSYPSSTVALVEGQHAYGTMVYDRRFPLVILNAWGLDALPTDKTYQVWLMLPDGGRINGGIFTSGGGRGFDTILIRAPEAIRAFVSLGVTVEPSGGSPEPSGPRVLSGDF